MLIEFSVGNYRSFKEIVTLSMVAANLSSKPKQLDEDNVIPLDNNLYTLKSAVIYGANAHGKSNLIAALGFMRSFILSSSRETQVTQRVGVEPFRLSTETEAKPSHFEIVFVHNGVQYRYGFEATTEHIVAEWLYHTPGRKEARLFQRDADGIKPNARTFKEGRGLEQRTRANALFLSVVAQFNGTIATSLLVWFAGLGISQGLDDLNEMIFAMHRFEDVSYQDKIVEFVARLDVGIDNILMERRPATLPDIQPDLPPELAQTLELLSKIEGAEHVAVKTVHKRYDSQGVHVGNAEFELQHHESHGTQKLFALAYPILRTLHEGRILIIDEFDARLHPLISCELIKLFNSRRTNPHNAQLIITTHDTNLLSRNLFRRDQIWFVEKSGRGVSDLYSLVEYREEQGKMVRNDASFEKDYIAGRYGAIPFIGDIAGVLGEPNEHTQGAKNGAGES